MDKRDQELLDKQLWGVSPSPPRNDLIIGLTVVAMFFFGIAMGDILFAHQPPQLTLRDAMAVISPPHDAPPIMR